MLSETDQHIEKLLSQKQERERQLKDCKKRLADVREEKRLVEIRLRTIVIDLENAWIAKARLDK